MTNQPPARSGPPARSVDSARTEAGAGQHHHPPTRQIRAVFDDHTVRVYQAYRPQIAEHALEHGRFPTSWSRSRMTWIKPSFLWMMYRCGWATKPDQERVLALDITREGFHQALAHACLSHHRALEHGDRDAWRRRLRSTRVRVQWDPERDLFGRPLPHRSLQLGLSGWATAAYADTWITAVRDVTALAQEIHLLRGERRVDEARGLLPAESRYPLPDDLARTVGMLVSSEG